MRARVLYYLILALLVSALMVQAFGISFQYMENDTLKLYPGQNYLFKLTVQNKDPEELKVSVKLDSDIATIAGSENLTIPPATFDRSVLFNITVPKDAKLNQQYVINYQVAPLVAAEGQIPLTLVYDRSFKVLVVKKPEEKPAVIE
jgi:hypothetical protein